MSATSGPAQGCARPEEFLRVFDASCGLIQLVAGDDLTVQVEGRDVEVETGDYVGNPTDGDVEEIARLVAVIAREHAYCTRPITAVPEEPQRVAAVSVPVEVTIPVPVVTSSAVVAAPTVTVAAAVTPKVISRLSTTGADSGSDSATASPIRRSRRQQEKLERELEKAKVETAETEAPAPLETKDGKAPAQPLPLTTPSEKVEVPLPPVAQVAAKEPVPEVKVLPQPPPLEEKAPEIPSVMELPRKSEQEEVSALAATLYATAADERFKIRAPPELPAEIMACDVAPEPGAALLEPRVCVRALDSLPVDYIPSSVMADQALAAPPQPEEPLPDPRTVTSSLIGADDAALLLAAVAAATAPLTIGRITSSESLTDVTVSRVGQPRRSRDLSLDEIDDGFGRVVQRRPSGGSKKTDAKVHFETPSKESPTSPSRKTSSTRKSYPKRENRKPPAHLMDMFDPPLFSKPDRMKKIDSKSDDDEGGETSDVTAEAVETPLPEARNLPKKSTEDIEAYLSRVDGANEDADPLDPATALTGIALSRSNKLDESPNLETKKMPDPSSKSLAARRENRKPMPSRKGEFRRNRKDKKRRMALNQEKKAAKGTTGGRESDSSSSSGSSSATDSDWCSEDDPDRLWCICNQPHNDRFMISCDKCEDWYHGTCVGVSRKQGREWEKNGQEWTCPKCVRAKAQLKEKRPDPRIPGKPPEKVEEKGAGAQALPLTKTACAQKPTPREREKPKVVESPTKDRSPPLRLGEVSKAAPKPGELDPKMAQRVPRIPLLEKLPTTVVVQPTPPSPVQRTVVEAGTEAVRAQLCVVGCGRAARPDSIFCGNECILQHADEAVKVVGKEKEKEKERKQVVLKSVIKPEIKREVTADQILAIDKSTGKVVPGPTAFGSAQLREFLRQHPNVQLVKAREKKEPASTTAVAAPVATIAVQRDIPQRKFYGTPQKTIKLISAQQMPVENLADKKTLSRGQSVVSEKKEAPAVPNILKKATPEPRRLSADNKVKATPSVVPRTPEPKKRLSVSSLAPTASSTASGQSLPPTQSGPEPIRESVLKSLRETLASRNSEIEEDPLTGDEVKKVADSIEEELFKLFSDVGTKYKAKYRSLVFNIKDPRNHGLFQKILRGKISPFKLVRMTPEELASKELAMWREREAKHTLEMIKREQEEQKHVPIIKKTHKGEIEIDDTDVGFSEKSKPKVEFTPAAEAILSPLVDTTDAHRSHLFDLNCKICTGQMLAPTDVADPSAKKVRVATSISMEARSQDEESEEEGRATTTKEEGSAKKNKEETARRGSRSDGRDKLQKEKDQRGKDDKKDKDRHQSSSRTKGSCSKQETERTQSKERDKSKDSGKPKDSGKSKDGSKIKARDNSKADSRLKEKEKTVSTDKSKEREKDKNKTTSRSLEGDKKTGTSRKDSETKGSDKGKGEQSKGTKRSSGVVSDPNDRSRKLKKTKVEDADVTVTTKTSDDREPSSTVNIGSPDSAVTSQTDIDNSKSSQSSVWKGFITMQDVAKFVTSAYKVAGPTDFLAQDIPDTIQVCGRIAPDTVWDYLNKVKQSGNKEFLVIRFNPANEEENVSFGLFYTYLNSRNRFGVVGNCSKVIKDFYILPLGSDVPIPETLLPFEYFEGLDESRTDTLLGVIVRHKGKRKAATTNGKSSKSSKKLRMTATKSNAVSIEEEASGDSKGSETATGSKRVKFDLKVNTSVSLTEDRDAPYEPSYTPPLDNLVGRPTNDSFASPYDPSYTPPLGDSGKATAGDDSPYSPGQATSGGGADDDDDDQPYDPEEGHGTDSVPSIIPGLLAGSVSSQSVSDLIDHISMSSNPTASASSVLASIATATNLEQQRQLLIELTQKVEEQKKQLERQKQQIATKVTAQVMGAMAAVPSFTAALSNSATTVAASLAATARAPVPTPPVPPPPVKASTAGEIDSSRDSPYEPGDEDEPTYTPSYTPPMENNDGDEEEKKSQTSESRPRPGATLQLTDTSSISLPPNLQEILESIKKQAANSTSADQEQPTMPVVVKPPVSTTILDDPIVRSYSLAVDEAEEAGTPPRDSPTSVVPPTKQSDPRLGRPKMSAVRHDPRRKVPATIATTSDAEKKKSELGSMSASQLLEKAMRQLADMSDDADASTSTAAVSTPVELFSPPPSESTGDVRVDAAATTPPAAQPTALRTSLLSSSLTVGGEEPPPPGMESNLSVASIPVPSIACPPTLPPSPVSTMPYAMPPLNMYGHLGVSQAAANPLGVHNFSIPPPAFIQPSGYMPYPPFQQQPPSAAPPPPLPFTPQQHGPGGNLGYWQSGAASQDWHSGGSAGGSGFRERGGGGGRWDGNGGSGRGRRDYNTDSGDQAESWSSRRSDRRHFDHRGDRRSDRHPEYRKSHNQGRDHRGPRNRDRSRSRERDSRQHGRYRDKGRGWERGRDRERERSWDRNREENWDRERSKDDDRSRSKDRDRSASRDRDRSRSRDRGLSRNSRDDDRSPSRNRDRSRSRDHDRSPSMNHDRSRSRDRDRSESRDRDRSPSKDRDRSRSKDGDRSRSKDRERSKSKDRDSSRNKDRDRSRSKDRDRSRSKDRDRCRSKDPDRSPNKDRDRRRSMDRDRSKSTDRDSSMIKDRDRATNKDHEHSRSQECVAAPTSDLVPLTREDPAREQNINSETELKEGREALLSATVTNCDEAKIKDHET